DIEQYGDYSLKAAIAMKKIIEPMFEARNDFDIFSELADRLGKKQEFTEGKSEMEWLEEFYGSALDQAKGMGQEIPDFDDFWEQGFVEFALPPTPSGTLDETEIVDYAFTAGPLTLTPATTGSTVFANFNFDALGDIVAEAERLAAAPRVETLGEWSLGQILEHVARAMDAS
ncbi:MAG: DUF1569 domain-containing protein, partial [Actinomycetota bacterium]